LISHAFEKSTRKKILSINHVGNVDNTCNFFKTVLSRGKSGKSTSRFELEQKE